MFLCCVKGMVLLDVREIVQKFDAMLAEGRVSEAGRWLEEAAEECRKNGDYASCVTVFNELEGFGARPAARKRALPRHRQPLLCLSPQGSREEQTMRQLF